MILITGGNGYIGTALSEILRKKGERYRIFDNLSGSSPLNLFYLDGDVDFIWGDIRNLKELNSAFNGIDAVIHLAAKLPTAPGMIDDVSGDVASVNVKGTENILELARRYDTKVVFASTCNLYGIGESLNESSEVKPLNPYAKSKLEAEKLCLDYYKTYGLDIVILRLASVFGYSPGVRFNLVANYFTLRALMNYPLTVFGDGSNWRPFIHVKDAARAFLHFLENGKSGDIYNVGNENETIGNLAQLVKSVVNQKVEIIYIKEKQPEFSYSVDFTKAFNTGFKAKYSLRRGILDLSAKLIYLKNYSKA